MHVIENISCYQIEKSMNLSICIVLLRKSKYFDAMPVAISKTLMYTGGNNLYYFNITTVLLMLFNYDLLFVY